MEANTEIVSKERRLFIKRERIRRALTKTKPGETICLQSEEVEILLDWLKELERKSVKQYGYAEVQKAGSEGQNGGAWH